MVQVSAKTIRLFLVDDHAMVLAGLSALLEAYEDLSIIGTADSLKAGVEGIGLNHPDVALIDMRLPDGNGAKLCKQAKAASPDTKFIILTSYSDDSAIFDAIAAGVDGYLLKEVETEALVDAVRSVYAGKSILAPGVTHRVFGRLQGQMVETPIYRMRLLSKQERRVLAQVAEGMTNKEVGCALNLSDKTVKNYLSNAMQKLQVGRRTEAVAFYIRYGSAIDA